MKKKLILGLMAITMALFSSTSFADNENAVRVMSTSTYENNWQNPVYYLNSGVCGLFYNRMNYYSDSWGFWTTLGLGYELMEGYDSGNYQGVDDYDVALICTHGDIPWAHPNTFLLAMYYEDQYVFFQSNEAWG